MPIVYVHGVSTRESSPGYEYHRDAILKLLQIYVAPTVSPTCKCTAAYWGDHGATFAWDRASRPRTRISGMGAGEPQFSQFEKAMALTGVQGALSASLSPASPGGTLVPAGPTIPAAPQSAIRLKDLDPDQLSDLLGEQIRQTLADAPDIVELLTLVDQIALDSQTRVKLQQCNSLDDELEAIRALTSTPRRGLAAQGGDTRFGRVLDRVREVASRAINVPGYVVSTVIAESREPINSAVTLFLGDVLTYIANRGTHDQPGLIPSDVLGELRAAKEDTPNEPLVVLTHSMGGQIVYDIVTHFLPEINTDLRVDFWCATASQVGLFEEMKLFARHSDEYSSATGKKTPFPARKYLGGWWNVWDYNDFLSYTAQPIFEGVIDEPFNGGVSLVQAHSEYLVRPSFYRKLAEQVKLAQAQNWWRP